MRIKEYINAILYFTKSLYFKLHTYIWIPAVWVLVVLPAVNAYDLLHPNEFSQYFINQRILSLLPVGIAGMVFLYLRDDIDGIGKEVLYLYAGKRHLQMLWMSFLYSILFLMSELLLYRKYFGDYNWIVCTKAILLVFTFTSLLYALLYLLKSNSLAVSAFTAIYIMVYVLSNTELCHLFRYDYGYASCPLSCVLMVVGTALLCTIGHGIEQQYMLYCIGELKTHSELPHRKDKSRLQDSKWIRTMTNIWLQTGKYIGMLLMIVGIWIGYLWYRCHIIHADNFGMVFQIGCGMFLPIECILIFCMLYWARISGEGKEVLSFYQKHDLPEICIGYITEILSIGIVICLFWQDIDQPGYQMLKFMLVAFGYFGLCYGVAFTTNSMIPAFVTAFAVYLISLMPQATLLSVTDIGMEPYNMGVVLQTTWVYLLLGVAGFVAGAIRRIFV